MRKGRGKTREVVVSEVNMVAAVVMEVKGEGD